MEPVDLDAKRKAKAKEAKCDICGGPEHVGALACPRIAAITYWPDGAVSVDLAPFDEEPPVAG
jgi:hypothetical protein